MILLFVKRPILNYFPKDKTTALIFFLLLPFQKRLYLLTILWSDFSVGISIKSNIFVDLSCQLS